MGYHTDGYYRQQERLARKASGTAYRDAFGNLIPGEGSGIDQRGQVIPMGQRPLEQGLHSGNLSTGAPTRGPSAFDEKFGTPQAPPTRTITPAAPVAPAPVTAPGAPTGTLPGYTQSIKPGVQPPAAPAPATRTVAAPDAFGTTRTNMSGQGERWQPSEATGTGKWIATGGLAAPQVALPSNPDDRALLMETRKRDAMARQPDPISIPGGDPAARAWNTARGTGHASTPEPGARPAAPAMAPPDAFRPMPAIAAAAGTGQTVQTPFGTASSTVAKPGAPQTPAIVSNTGVVHPPAPAAPQAMPAGVTASAQMRSAASPAQAPAASVTPPPAPPVGAPSRTSMLTGGNPPPLTVAPPPMITPAASLSPAPAQPSAVNPQYSAQLASHDNDLAQAQEWRKKKDAAARASIDPFVSPDDSMRPRARAYKRTDALAVQ